ncbi:MAG: hypothetical protein D6820_04120 [Lentisphaerae bacterium]|nr:MAG: hypothetical protein D6820_04120 [Lentisphaerota bacterium]
MSSCTCEKLAFDQEVNQLLRRNYFLNAIEGGIYIGGMAFISADVILPPFAKQLGASEIIVSLMPILLRVGFLIPPLFTLPWILRMRHMKPFVNMTGLLQRCPLLIAGLMLIYAYPYYPRLTLIVAILSPFISGIFGGLSFSAWMELVSRIIPPQRRASCWALRALCTGIIGLGAGKITQEILRLIPGVKGYGCLFLIATAFVFLSYILFLMIREPSQLPPAEPALPSITSVFDLCRQLPDFLRAHPDYTRFLLSRVVGCGIFLMLPFFSLFALHETGRPPEFLGILVMWQMAGTIVGNLSAAYLGDRFGGKLLLILARILYIGGFLPLFFWHSEAIFAGAFFMSGLATNLDQVGDKTMGIELIPVAQRVILITISTVFIMPAMIAGSLGSVLIRYMHRHIFPDGLDPFLVALAISLTCLVISGLILLSIPEPRRNAASSHRSA